MDGGRLGEDGVGGGEWREGWRGWGIWDRREGG